jgi:uncharacterized phiE125 gp8 family phage protein
MTPKLITPPTTEPMTLAEARRFLRQDVPGYSADTAQDLDILSWVRAARQYVERATDKSIGFQTLMVAMDSFVRPWATWDTWPVLCELPNGPVHQIVSITYIDVDGADQVVDPTIYRLTQIEPQAVVLLPGKSWPIPSVAPESVRIQYRAGFDTSSTTFTTEAYADNYADNYTGSAGATQASEFPGAERCGDDLIAAMRLLLGDFYRHREATVFGVVAELPLGVRALIWPNRASIGL